MINGKSMKIGHKKGFSFKSRIGVLMAVALIALSACAYEGVDNPVARKFSWFSYIAADDIVNNCPVKKGDRYRFVYNAVYNEQVRTYDIIPAEPGRFRIYISVVEEAKIDTIITDATYPDVYQPWHPKRSITNLSGSDIETLRKSLKDVDFFDSSPPREDLPSIGFYWVVSACVKGKFTQNAFLWPHKKFKAAQFGKLLSAWDFTDIPVNPPRETSHLSVYGTNDSEEFINDFNLKFGSNGLIRHTVLI